MLFVTRSGGCNIEGEDDGWDFGSGAGFYVDATEEKWRKHYNMYSYVTEELPLIIHDNFPTKPDSMGVFGHSMVCVFAAGLLRPVFASRSNQANMHQLRCIGHVRKCIRYRHICDDFFLLVFQYIYPHTYCCARLPTGRPRGSDLRSKEPWNVQGGHICIDEV